MRDINPRSAAAFLHDVLAAGAAWLAAFWFRFNFDIQPDFLPAMWHTVGWVVALDALCFWKFGLYRGLWRYASIHDLRLILVAVGIAAIAFPALLVLVRPAFVVPRSVFVLHPLLLLFFMGGSRLLYRAWKERDIGKLGARNGKPVVVLGAGDTAVSLLKDLSGSPEWRVIGLLDDDDAKQKRQILGATVLGRIADLPSMAARFAVGYAILAMPDVSHDVRRRVVGVCQAAGLKMLTVPSFDDLVSGKVTVSQIRKVELDDLLGRDPVSLDAAGLAGLLEGRTVMVTGAGGSIGAELCRQIARYRPARLVMFELSEYALYQVEQEFQARWHDVPVTCMVGDAKNAHRVAQALGRHRPQVIFHAAAYKHVPLMEQENAWEAVRNNVYGTYVLASEAMRHGVQKFVLISTDKAVNPVNVMGASKRLAEMVCQSLQRPQGTRFVMVRFGNVLGSAGSVIPKFREQIAAGGPVTVTHPEITRYFMSIPEAAQLVLQAGAMGRGGEIFVLDMGEPVRIVDLARDMIRLSGLNEADLRIVFTGLRPGEKLYEEVLADGEHTLATPHPKLRIARAREVEAQWLAAVLEWLEGTDGREDDEVRGVLRRLVPEYDSASGAPAAGNAGKH
ncbi:MAG TPA: nucleoside-diphosphate sugar epimerase/dehydratase [Burkholderiales bacterium]|nr:nucleoside-diphosphate sugar epimerase/dehydratase [Burkholderiales bacterium]